MNGAIEVKEVPGTDDVAIELPQEIIDSLSLKEGDSLKWTVRDDGSILLTKVGAKKVLVETVRMFRMRYIIDVDVDQDPSVVVDELLMNEPEEFTQRCIDEVVVSYREVSEEEIQRIYREDNS